MNPRRHLQRISWPLAAAVLASAAQAQRVADTTCHSNSSFYLSQYGHAVALGDLDGDGRAELIVGAPQADRQGQAELQGAVFFGNVWASPGWGDDPFDRMGHAVISGLRLDGDSLDDVVAGAPGDDDNGDNAGSVRAFRSDKTALYTIHGDGPGDVFGSSLARLADLDGDGRDDYLVGAPQSPPEVAVVFTASTVGAGYAKVISGADGATLRTHHGSQLGDRFGQGLTGLDDVNGDGIGDYAIGAPRELGAGRVRIYSGADGSLIDQLDGLNAGDDFGYDLGSGSDLDRDGLDELLVGAPRIDDSDGYATAYSGADRSVVRVFSAGPEQHWFGFAVAGAGDFDGDGHGDVVLGAPGEGPGPQDYAYGEGMVLSGADGSVLLRMGGENRDSYLGYGVDGGRNLNQDGLPDVALGGLYVNDGYSLQSCAVGLARDTSHRIDLTAGASHSSYGRALAGIGDLDGDGFGELLIGAPEALDPNGQKTGMARLVSGSTGITLREFYGDFDDDWLGRSVANAGDVDGDGFDDLAVGSADVKGSTTFGSPTGYVKVFSGATGVELHHFQGPTRHFGATVAGQGDVDGDGRADLIAGISPEAYSPGHVRVYSGATGQELYAFDGPSRLGASVSFIGDLTGDGVDDFLFGVPDRYITNPWHVGEIELHSGADGSLVNAFWSYDTTNGIAIGRLGDVNQDGFEDFAFSTSYEHQLGSYGSVFVYSGQDQTELWMGSGTTNYAGLTYGYDVADVGDWDGDGVSDVGVGTPGLGGAHARAFGQVQILSGATGTYLASYTGYSGWDYFGYSIAGLGDVNGDGLADLAIGAPTDGTSLLGGPTGPNRVHVLLTQDLVRHNHCLLSPNSGGQPATIDARGLASAPLANVTLDVADAPPGAPGVFLMGDTTTQLPFGAGSKCLSGVTRRLSGPMNVDGTGSLSLSIDFTTGSGAQLQPGTTWSFQYVFRDGGELNTTDAVRFDVTP